jgi:hypothetical protein
MAYYTYVNIRLPEAKRLSDLFGVHFDLLWCRDYCDKYLEAYANIEQRSSESRHLECFSVYIFVKYGRCFKGGIRSTSIEQFLATLAPEDRELHQLVINIRDKYIAHSVNDLESHKVRVWLNPEEEGRKINDVNIEGHYLAGPDPELFEKLKQLIDKILSWISAEQKQEREKLVQLVGQRFELDKLYSLEPELPNRIDYSRTAQPRRNP